VEKIRLTSASVVTVNVTSPIDNDRPAPRKHFRELRDRSLQLVSRARSTRRCRWIKGSPDDIEEDAAPGSLPILFL
jgi:hypothetical protein